MLLEHDDWTLGLSTTESMMVNFVSGDSSAMVSSGVA